VKYSFTLLRPEETDDLLAGNVLDREKIVLESRSTESVRHIALKILAYLWFRAEAAPLPLLIERSVGQRHKPDLVAMDPATGSIRLWIDCGQIEPKRLARILKANPNAQVLVLKASIREARLYARSASLAIPTDARTRLHYLGFDDGFLAEFAGTLRGANSLACLVAGDMARIVLNQRAFDARLQAVTEDLENY